MIILYQGCPIRCVSLTCSSDMKFILLYAARHSDVAALLTWGRLAPHALT